MNEDVGGRIHRLRTARGLTQRELAADRYTSAYVSSVESGRRVPSTDALAHFAALLGVSAEELATGSSPDLQVRLGLELAGPAVSEADYLRLAEHADELGRAHCQVGLGYLALRRDDLDAAARAFAEAGRLSAGAPAHLRAAPVIGEAECLRRQGDPRYAVFLLRRALDELAGAGLPDPGALLGLNVRLALCHRDLDDEDAAAGAASAALALAGPADAGALADLHLTVGRTLLSQGDTRGAEGALSQARQARGQAGLAVELAECRLIRGRARHRAGDLDAAARDLTEALTGLTGRPDGTVGARGEAAVELAAVYRGLGRRTEARVLLEDVPAAGPAGDRVLAALAADEGDVAGAERHLRAAADGYRRAGPRRSLAAVLLALADNLEAQDRAAEAVTLLRDGLAEVERLSGDSPRSD
ncbi:transcriptional regulator [Actinoplanes ianthinogenes]|uniref:Transcriptional regulator n=1 Tax=Actinoplanes ianthinogenes TaxID=122358 RepID=A0ABM7M874_9ACTN|nr:helix-turn-helix transcriptional regulator [Actinoplanes ianthinogenes]BCJ47806.1 transcriptional regulator [Actinoplanes ianthinogenes]GGR04279.1 transcriptional regulator [Actinoplanes ianthinogenes]